MALAPVFAASAQDATPKINKKNLVVKEWNTNAKGVAKTLDHVTTYSAEGKKNGASATNGGLTASRPASWSMTSGTGW